MCFKQSLLIATALLSITAFNAEASLTSFTGTDGAGLVYSSVTQVAWTKDANLFLTMANNSGNSAAFVNSVIASAGGTVTGIVNSNPFDPVPAKNTGVHTLSATDFNTSNGQMSWWGANAWTSYLNSISYGGFDTWRLPTHNQLTGFNSGAGNELGQLFFSELGAIPSNGNTLSDSSYFINEIKDPSAPGYLYWSGTEPTNTLLAGKSWNVDAQTGRSGNQYNHYAIGNAWAVTAVPVPASVWFMGSALFGLLGLNRRRQLK